MQRLEAGMTVRGVRGRTVGAVAAIHASCFEVDLQDAGGARLCLGEHAVFTVDQDVVALICSKEDIDRYRCREHSGL